MTFGDASNLEKAAVASATCWKAPARPLNTASCCLDACRSSILPVMGICGKCSSTQASGHWHRSDRAAD